MTSARRSTRCKPRSSRACCTPAATHGSYSCRRPSGHAALSTSGWLCPSFLRHPSLAARHWPALHSPSATLTTSARCGGRRPSARWQPRTCLPGASSASRSLTTRASALLPQRSAFRPALLSLPSPLPPSLATCSGSATCATHFAGGLGTSSCSSSLPCCLTGGGRWPQRQSSLSMGHSVMRPKSSTRRPPPSDHPAVWCAPFCLTAASVMMLSPTLPFLSPLACGSPAAPSVFLSRSPSCPGRCERSLRRIAAAASPFTS